MLNATTDVGTNYHVQSLQTIENEINSAMQIAESIENCHDIRPLRTKLHIALIELKKDPLATLVEILFNLFENNLELRKSAASKVDQLKMEQLDSQQEIIKMKQDGLDLWM